MSARARSATKMAQTKLKSRCKGHSGMVLGHLARKLKMTARARSAANALNWAEILSKRPFWRGSGAPGQEAENGCQGQICSTLLKLGRNPVEKAILEGS